MNTLANPNRVREVIFPHALADHFNIFRTDGITPAWATKISLAILSRQRMNQLPGSRYAGSTCWAGSYGIGTIIKDTVAGTK
jgi:hypothetical protein